MPASLRIEIFPSDLQRCVQFYTKVLQFQVIKHKGNYVYFERDNIFIGALEVASQDSWEERTNYRRPTKGIEIVIEVDNLFEERDRIVAKGFELEDDIKLQEWDLEDFRMLDPDGYYLRFTTHSRNNDGKGDHA